MSHRSDGRAQFLTIKVQFIAALRDNLQSRFISTPMCSAFSCIFNPRGYPSSESQLNGYGDEEIKVLCDFYGAENHAVPPIINAARTVNQWPEFRAWMWHQFVKPGKVPHMREALRKVLTNDTLRAFSFNLYSLAEIALVLPVAVRTWC
jgi:hypothetical protein